MSKFYDTLIWEYIKNPWNANLSIEKLANKYLNYQTIIYKKDDLKEKTSDNLLNIKNILWEKVYIISKLYYLQIKDSEINQHLLNEIEFPLINIIKDMEIDWVKIDINKLNELWSIFKQELVILKEKIFKEAWEEFNINSPKQVGEILFNKLWLEKWKKNKTWYSVSQDILLYLSLKHTIAKNIIDYRHYSKLLSNYIDWLIKIKDSKDFVHTSYNQTLTKTWRLSSTNPNLQNIPVWDNLAWQIREAFISRFKNWKILAIDYSQVELRLLAIISKDENLIEIFKKSEDIHKSTAKYIFWKDDISSSERKIAKAVNFWTIYWISAFGLSKMINISQKDAKIYIDKFYKSYPKVKSYINETIDFCKKNNYVETLYWRKRYIPSINDSNNNIRQSAEREAINMPIQWTSADITKIAMIRSFDFIKENNLKSKLIMQVHDELVFDILEEEIEILSKNIKNIMENVLVWKEISLLCDLTLWDNWKLK